MINERRRRLFGANAGLGAFCGIGRACLVRNASLSLKEKEAFERLATATH
jgi:hypothetical protein